MIMDIDLVENISMYLVLFPSLPILYHFVEPPCHSSTCRCQKYRTNQNEISILLSWW